MKGTDKISQLLEEIRLKKDELIKEYEKIGKKYNFAFQGGKLVFSKKAKDTHLGFKTGILKYVFSLRFRHFLSIPFIYGMIFPTIILDVCLLIYQQTALRLYGIPLVKRSDYVVFDRRHLHYLNFIQKINCLYCSYVNGVFSYAVEIAGRTEKYWCPIKAARRKKGGHDWEEYFADFGDPEGFQKTFNSNKEFFKKKK